MTKELLVTIVIGDEEKTYSMYDVPEAESEDLILSYNCCYLYTAKDDLLEAFTKFSKLEDVSYSEIGDLDPHDIVYIEEV